VKSIVLNCVVKKGKLIKKMFKTRLKRKKKMLRNVNIPKTGGNRKYLMKQFT
jgi:hypothetical protein